MITVMNIRAQKRQRMSLLPGLILVAHEEVCMEAASTSETSEKIYQTTRLDKPDESILRCFLFNDFNVIYFRQE